VLPLVAAVAMSLLLWPAAEAQKPSVDRPTYAVGETWSRDDGAFELIRMDGPRYVFAARAGEEIHLTRDLTIEQTVRDGRVEWEFSPPVALTWPLEVGKWGAAPSNVRLRSRPITAPGSASVTAERVIWQVEAVEAVSVPAGTFQAFRVALTATASPEHGSVPLAQLTTWYAPALRQLVKAVGTQALAPLGFQLAAGPNAAKRQVPAAITTPAAAMLPAIQLRLVSPEDKVHVEHETLALAVSVSSGGGVTGVVATLNGVDVAHRHETSPR
jgi:hypothetical protein